MTDLDLHTAPEPCQQAVTEALDRLRDSLRQMPQDSNGFVPMSAVLRKLSLVRSAS